ncbi:MAG: hypothetical protein HYY63_05380, partial [Elusimicrobia bacterium]|nr:hypothetical protein [Elusimicrobiota bacterium]
MIQKVTSSFSKNASMGTLTSKLPRMNLARSAIVAPKIPWTERVSKVFNADMGAVFKKYVSSPLGNGFDSMVKGAVRNAAHAQPPRWMPRFGAVEAILSRGATAGVRVPTVNIAKPFLTKPGFLTETTRKAVGAATESKIGARIAASQEIAPQGIRGFLAKSKTWVSETAQKAVSVLKPMAEGAAAIGGRFVANPIVNAVGWGVKKATVSLFKGAVKLVDAVMISQAFRSAYKKYEKGHYSAMGWDMAMILLLLFVPLSLGRAAEALPAAAPVKISEQIFGQTLFSATRFAAKPSEFVVGWVGGALQGARRFSTLNAAGLGDLMTLLPSYHEERLEVNGKEVGTGRYTFAWGKFHFLDFDERYASAQGGAQMGLIFGLTSPLFQPMWAEMVPVLRTFSMGGRAIKGIESLSNKLISGSGEIISTAYSVTVFGLVGTGLSMSVDSLGLAGTPLGVLKNEFVNMVISVIVAPTAGRAPRIAFTKAYGRVHGVGAEIPVLGARTVSHDQVAFAEEVRNAREGNRGLDFDYGSLSQEEVRQLFGTAEEVVVTALLDQGQHEGVRETWREYQSRPEEEGFADLPNYPL